MTHPAPGYAQVIRARRQMPRRHATRATAFRLHLSAPRRALSRNPAVRSLWRWSAPSSRSNERRCRLIGLAVDIDSNPIVSRFDIWQLSFPRSEEHTSELQSHLNL